MKQLFSLAFLILVLNFNAQIKHEFGPDNKEFENSRIIETLGGNDEFLYTHKISTRGSGVTNFIEKIDRKTLVRTEFKKLEFSDENMGLKRLVYCNNKLLAFTTNYHKKEDKTSLIVVISDINTLSVISEIELTSFGSYSKVNVNLNEDKTKAVIKIAGESSTANSLCTEFVVFDMLKGVKAFEKKITEPYVENSGIIRGMKAGYIDAVYYYDDFNIDAADNIHYAYLTKNANSTKTELLTDLHYATINSKSLMVEDIVLSKEFKCNTLSFKITNVSSSQSMISGIYREVNSGKKYNELTCGIFNYTCDNAKLKVTQSKFTPKEKFITESELNNNPKKILKDYVMDESFTYNNACYLIGHKVHYVDMSSSSVYGITNIHYSDLFVVKVSNSCDIEYCKMLPFYSISITEKDQDMADMEKYFRQYISVIQNGNLYVLHNEHPKTTEILNSNDKVTAYPAISAGKQIIVNKFNLSNGTNIRETVEIQSDNKFYPILEPNPHIGKPIESSIFEKRNNDLFIPLLGKGGANKILKITL